MAKKMGTGDSRLDASVLIIKSACVELRCEVCKKLMGFAEAAGCSSAEGPAAYCSDKCILTLARDNLRARDGR